MIKNTTRRGLAVLSSMALAVAGLVGISAPASATSLVILKPKVGTEYAVPLDAAFTLETRSAASDNPYGDDMFIEVVDADEQLQSVTFSDRAQTPNSATITFDTPTTTFEGELNLAAGAFADIVLTPKSTATATFSVTVRTGFTDGQVSPVRTVTFHKAADYTWNLAFTTPVVGDAKFGAVVSTTPQLNLAQVLSSVKVAFGTVNSSGVLSVASAGTAISSDTTRFANGLAASVTADVSAQTDGSYKWSTNVTTTNGSTAAAIADSNTYVAQVLYGSAEVGTRAVIKPAAATITKLVTPALAASTDTKGTDFRVGATAVTVETTAYTAWTSATDNTPTAAGQVVKVTITGSLDSKASVTAGGKTLTSTTSGGKIEFDATVGASGKVSIPVALSGVVATNTFTVAVAAQSATATAGSLSATFTAVATAAGQMVDHNLMGDSAIWKVEHGTYTIRFAVLDNFDQPLAGTGYRVVLSNGTAAEDVAQPVVNGVATFSVNTKNAAGNAVTSFSAQLQTVSGLVSTNSGNPVTLTVNAGSSNAAATVTVDDGTTTAATGNKFTLPATGTYALSLKDLKAANTRLGETATSGITAGVTLGGSIVDANNVGTYGNVTIEAEGLLFSANTPGSKEVYSMDSITVQTNAVGAFDGVKVYSNTAGKVTVKVSSGAASQDVVLTFAAAAQNTGTTLVIDAPYVVEPGSSFMATATLTDKYGNVVKSDLAAGPTFSMSIDRAFIPIGSAPTATDANGQAKVAYVLGSNDKGVVVVTATYDADGTGTASAAISTQFTIVIGTLGNTGPLNAWTSNKGDGTVKVYAKNIVKAGKVQFFFNDREIAWVNAADETDPKLRTVRGAAYLVRTVNLVEGQKNVIEIYVDGERVERTAYTY